MALSDAELIQGCLEKNRKAWDSFVGRFSKLIYWNIRKVFEGHGFSSRQEILEDVFQEVFERLIEKEELGKLRSAENLRKYLSVLAAHAALDKIRIVGRLEKKIVSDDLIENYAKPQISLPEANETSALIRSVLGELSFRERTCVEFHYFSELSFREIGEILNISEDAASSVVRRAKEKIKIRLEGKLF